MKRTNKFLLLAVFSALIFGTALAHNGPETMTEARESYPVIQQPQNPSPFTVIPADDPRSQPGATLIKELREMNKPTQKTEEPENA